VSKKIAINCTTGQIEEVELTQEELAIIQPIPTREQLLELIRLERNALLAQSDWTQLIDTHLTEQQKTAWAAYRQALRDLPETVDAENPIYPTKPN
jgi:hypothetical protein